MVFAGFLLTCLIGWVILPPRWDAAFLPKLCFSFAAGMFLISLEIFAFSLLGIAWTALTLLLPWVLAAGAYLWLARSELAVTAPAVPQPAWTLLLVAGVLVTLAAWAPYERLMPLTSQSWDAWAIWLFKAKAFYLDGDIATFLARTTEFTTQPGYPLLVPLYATFLYVLEGGVAAQDAKLLSPCSYIALLGVFYYFARRLASTVVASVFTLMLATLTIVPLVAFEFAGYADTTLSLYLLAAGGFLVAWYREGQMRDLVGASLAATAAAWTKNEGQFFLVAVVALAGVQLVRSKSTIRGWLVLLGPPLLVLGSWHLFRQAHQVEAAGFTLGLSFQLDLFRVALRTIIAKAFQLGLFNLCFLVLIGAAVAARPIRAGAAFWILPGLVIWHLTGALLAYSTGRNEIGWWLETSGDRILSQVAPLALLPGAWVFGLWMEKTAARRKPAEETSAKVAAHRKARRKSRAKSR